MSDQKKNTKELHELGIVLFLDYLELVSEISEKELGSYPFSSRDLQHEFDSGEANRYTQQVRKYAKTQKEQSEQSGLMKKLLDVALKAYRYSWGKTFSFYGQKMREAKKELEDLKGILASEEAALPESEKNIRDEYSSKIKPLKTSVGEIGDRLNDTKRKSQTNISNLEIGIGKEEYWRTKIIEYKEKEATARVAQSQSKPQKDLTLAAMEKALEALDYARDNFAKSFSKTQKELETTRQTIATLEKERDDKIGNTKQEFEKRKREILDQAIFLNSEYNRLNSEKIAQGADLQKAYINAKTYIAEHVSELYDREESTEIIVGSIIQDKEGALETKVKKKL